MRQEVLRPLAGPGRRGGGRLVAPGQLGGREQPPPGGRAQPEGRELAGARVQQRGDGHPLDAGCRRGPDELGEQPAIVEGGE